MSKKENAVITTPPEQVQQTCLHGLVPGQWIFQAGQFDTSPITKTELKELNRIFELGGIPSEQMVIKGLRQSLVLKRFIEPLYLVACLTHCHCSYVGHSAHHSRAVVVRGIASAMRKRKTGYWQWTSDDWVAAALEIGAYVNTTLAVAYLLGGQPVNRSQKVHPKRVLLAEAVFGRDLIRAQAKPVIDILVEWGYSVFMTSSGLTPSEVRGSSGRAMVTLAEAFLELRSPYLRDITADVLKEMRHRPDLREETRNTCLPLSQALHALKVLDKPLEKREGSYVKEVEKRLYSNMHPEWAAWVRKAHELAVFGKRHSMKMRLTAKAMGRWLFEHHPEITHPDQWTAEIAAEWVSAVDKAVVGQWGHVLNNVKPELLGKPWKAATKAGTLGSTRDFFRTLKRARLINLPNLDIDDDLATPTSITRLIGPAPRDIKQAAWMKLVWASLNLSDDDCTSIRYPPEFIRAVAVVWTHCGLRRDEITRLRLGCVSDVSDKVVNEMVDEEGARAATRICILQVPVSKTNTEFSKPVGKVVSDAIRAWEAVRPSQPPQLDHKTKDYTHFLFSYRAARIGLDFVNNAVIPMLCRKAGVPVEDVPGRKITSHRGRASAATWYYNTRNGMTLEELQLWLGHRYISSTQSYVRPSPVAQAKRFAEMHENSYLVEVLVDSRAIESGAAANGQPWQFFPLGNGDYCSNPFYAQCPHKMACPRCDFHVPAECQKAAALEARDGIQRMLMEMPLDEEERAALEDGVEALGILLEKLKDVATPDGRTPREIKGEDSCSKRGGRPTQVVLPSRTRRERDRAPLNSPSAAARTAVKDAERDTSEAPRSGRSSLTGATAEATRVRKSGRGA